MGEHTTSTAMGIGGSKLGGKQQVDHVTEGDETTFFAQKESPIMVGESLVNHLASNPPAPGAPSSERQASLDAAIQAKIRSEVSRLRAREAEIREQIERALEKENLDKESGADSGEGKVGGVSHSATLMRDLEELETRMVKITKKDTPAWHALGREREELVQCFRNNKTTPLNCQEAAQAFKATVANVEKEFVQSIHA